MTQEDRGELLFVWKMNGPRTAGSGVDLRDLEALAAQRTLIVEFAKKLWTEDGRPLPREFEDQIRLVFYDVARGSSSVAVYQPPEANVFRSEGRQEALPISDGAELRRKVVRKATGMAAVTTRAAISGTVPPYELSPAAKRSLKSVASNLGRSEFVDLFLPMESANDIREHVPEPATSSVRVARSQRSPRADVVQVAHILPSSVDQVQLAIAPTPTDVPIEDVDILEPFTVVAVDRKRRTATVEHVDGLFGIQFRAADESAITQALDRYSTAFVRLTARAIVDSETGAIRKITSVLHAKYVEPAPAQLMLLTLEPDPTSSVDISQTLRARPGIKRPAISRHGSEFVLPDRQVSSTIAASDQSSPHEAHEGAAMAYESSVGALRSTIESRSGAAAGLSDADAEALLDIVRIASADPRPPGEALIAELDNMIARAVERGIAKKDGES